MRTRDLKVGQWVRVHSRAPGFAPNIAGKVGQVRSIHFAGAGIDIDGGGYQEVNSRWLEPTHEPDTPEVAALKREIALAARDLARQHGLCSVVDEALEAMGIEPINRTIRIVLEIPESEFDVDAEEDNPRAIVIDSLHNVLDDSYSADREGWLKSAEYLEEETT